jgi:hypothetical protein
MSDQAAVNPDHIVGTVPAQPGAASIVHRERNGSPPAQASLVPAEGMYLNLEIKAGQPAKLLADHRRFQLALRGKAGVLPVTAAAATGHRVRAGRRDPIRRWPQYLNRVRPGEPGRALGNNGPDAFAWQRMTHENHPVGIILPGDAPPAVHSLANGEFQDVPGLRHG